LVNFAALLAFWRKKQTRGPEPERIIPLPPIPGMSLESSRSTSEEAVNRARETLKVLKVERQIIGAALTTIYESHTKGLINQTERDRLVEKYKVDLASLEKSIVENQRIVDLFDLESEREELVRNFNAKLAEIDAQVKTLKSGGSLNRPRKPVQGNEKKSNTSENESKKEQTNQEQPSKKSSETDEQQITDAEKRIDQIRADILQAMDRLEQIESEG
jgi:hypothetical protein